MRCLTLAEALREQNASCTFICREHSGNLIDFIRQKGFAALGLPQREISFPSSSPTAQLNENEPAHFHWLNADWRHDAAETTACLEGITADWLIVDHYALDLRWELALRPIVGHLMVIDDLADRKHICDILLDQNLGRTAGSYENLVPLSSVVLAGPKYALLRPEFSAHRNYSLSRRKNRAVKRLLITMGGTDGSNATARVLETLKDSALPEDVCISVVMGLHAPWLSQVQTLAKQMPWKTEVFVNTPYMANLMAECDLAIGAAGSTSWERCALGVPAIILVLAGNQAAIAHALSASGAALIADQNKLMGDLTHALELILQSNGFLVKMSIAAAKITNGTGTSYVVNHLFQQIAA